MRAFADDVRTKRQPRRRRGSSVKTPRVLAAVVVVCATGCTSGDIPWKEFSLVSVDQEIAIGREANDQVRRDVPEVSDTATTDYVTSIGERLVEAASGPEYPYTFSVADYREINAFALPGGPIWLHRGVLHAATNESQVAGVLAHEVAHIAMRHAAGQLTKGIMANLGLGLLSAMLGNMGGADTTQVAAQLLTNGIFLKFSRDDEREADRVGLQIMRDAGWDGRGMLELLELLQREARDNPSSVEIFFSSHPAPQDRVEGLRDAVAGAHGGTRDTTEFRSTKARLLKMPAPRTMPPQ
jgi:predicted Zn-dependent protease